MRKRDEIRRLLDSIDKLINDRKCVTAEKYLREYIDKNGDTDYPVVRKLAWVLTMNGKYGEAIDILQRLLERKDDFRASAAHNLAYIYSLFGEYEKSLEYINMCLDYPIKSNQFRQDSIYLKKRIEILIKLENNEEYNGNIFRYNNDEDAIKHIIDRHGVENDFDDSTNFDKKVNIESLFYRIKDEISTRLDLKYIEGLDSKYYHFLYPSVGYFNGKVVNILRVVVALNNQIVTMYPALMEIGVDFINSFKIEEIEQPDTQIPKVKVRKSQIDKFNQRYGKI